MLPDPTAAERGIDILQRLLAVGGHENGHRPGFVGQTANDLEAVEVRQFHIEGFVNQYVLESISADGKTVTFVTESIENIPEGWRGRETYMISENAFTEAFDLAEPGKDFEPYTKGGFKRK